MLEAAGVAVAVPLYGPLSKNYDTFKLKCTCNYNYVSINVALRRLIAKTCQI